MIVVAMVVSKQEEVLDQLSIFSSMESVPRSQDRGSHLVESPELIPFVF